MTDLIHVYLYESDPLQTWARRAEGYDDYYEIPAQLLDDFQRAEIALDNAREAITAYIKKHDVPRVSPWDEEAAP